ncbi:response regulator transcription factor [Clostridium thermobutyricum]|uniref:Stage 0 sporulation protein A homolog n=1 Tax=Clostridium thermobutyricum DSM 4928 TaxID=1121339 RepID=A0A1V4SUI5_9CLOT|nr:response regulator transcription factor [Clostridium thermobutyricum]OPX47136.1 transcriptional regulatory protein DegU [Clostridium thermobutyricum DSM 4928]
MKINLVIADDDSLIRESLKIILGSYEDINIMGTFSDGLEALKFINENDVDIAVLDVRMPNLNGVETIKEIRNEKTKSIVLTTFDEDEYIEKALKYGAKGYILKNTEPKQIIETIKMVYRGKSVIQEEVLEKIKYGLSIEEKEDLSKFTQREIEIIKEITNGLSNKEISKKLFISEGTVKNYITSILQKTNLDHRTQIAIKYLNKL